MIYSKSNPVGIDIKINYIQNKLHATFLALPLVTGQIDLHCRIYSLKEGLKSMPVKFITEFNKCLFTTDKVIVGYFYRRTDPINTNGMFSVTLGSIFHVNLKTVYPSITHRADEEFTKLITDIYSREPYGFKTLSISTGIDRVYSDFNFEESIEDIPPYFSIRFDLNINYRI